MPQPKAAKVFAKAPETQPKSPDHQAKLAAAQCDHRDINDPAHPDGDTYYAAMGREIDEHPIGRGRTRRGGVQLSPRASCELRARLSVGRVYVIPFGISFWNWLVFES